MDNKIKNRHRLKSKEIKPLQKQLFNIFEKNFFDEKSKIEIGELNGINLVFINGEPSFMIYKNSIVMTLNGVIKLQPKKNYVVIDMGAIKYVTNGADVMAPGIVDADIDIIKDQQVWICDERNHKPLAIGIALVNGSEMIQKNSGKSIKVIHYVGDELWSFVAKSL